MTDAQTYEVGVTLLSLLQCHNSTNLGIRNNESIPQVTSVSLEISSVDWAQQSMLLHEDGDRIQSPKRCF
jgi:hypothetical protein